MAKIRPGLCILKIFGHGKLKLRAWKPQICHFSIQGHSCVISLIIKLQQKVISLRPLWINGDYCIPLIDWLVFDAKFGNILAILWREQILWINFFNLKILRNKTYLCMLLFIAFCNCSRLWYFFFILLFVYHDDLLMFVRRYDFVLSAIVYLLIRRHVVF
jgi:hypothetical protein